jgi:hypothetical protein
MRSGAYDRWVIAIATVEEIKATSVSQVVQAGSGRMLRLWDGLGRGSLLRRRCREYDCQGRDVPDGYRVVLVETSLGNSLGTCFKPSIGQDPWTDPSADLTVD